MRIALGSDEPYPVHRTIAALLAAQGHDVVPFGAVAKAAEVPWVEVAEAVARAVAAGACDQGVLLCWTGTGVSIAANKVAGVRAALCADPGQARGARVWNHANVLCMSNRTLSDDMAREILEAWLGQGPDPRGEEGVRDLADLERRLRDVTTP